MPNQKSKKDTSEKSKIRNLKYLIEYIGLEVEVVNSSSPEQINIRGIVVDETKNTFKIEKPNGKEVVIPKKGSLFLFKRNSEHFIVEGSKILYSPEERLKKIKFE